MCVCSCVCVKKKRNAYENDEMVQYKQTKWPVITTRKNRGKTRRHCISINISYLFLLSSRRLLSNRSEEREKIGEKWRCRIDHSHSRR